MYPIAELGLFVNSKGSNLKMPPTIYLSPRPKEANAEIVNFNGKLVSIGIDDTGNGYISPPTMTVVGGGGEGASIETTAVGSIENILDLNPGSNYVGAPNVFFSGVCIKPEVSCEISGYISSVDIADCGSDYQFPPSIIVEGGGGRGAILEAKISGYIYKTVLLSGGKFPIDVIPTINIVSSGNLSYGGSITPHMRAIDSNYSTIHSLSITSTGSGYPRVPSISIAGYLPGFPALAYCLINAGISDIDIINPGSGYTSIPRLKVIRREPALPISSGNADFIYQIIESQTPTQTPTLTPSFTPTTTVTKTATITNSCTNTITRTQVSSPTPTPTRTPASSPTNRTLHGPIGTQNLPTSTISPSPTTTKTVTPSSTVTPSFTASPTVTRTQTQTPTITRTSTSTPTITKTGTQTPTFSATQTLTPSQTVNIFNPSHDAILIPRMRYSVSKINILQGGRYSSDPSGIIVKPPVVANNKAVITNPGSYCFGSRPNLKIRGSTISSPYRYTKEPEAIAIINYGIGDVEIINPGYNYTVPPTIRLIGGYDPIKGQPGQLSAQLNGTSVGSISISDIGNYYRTAPYISISSNDYGYGLEIKVKLSGVLEDIYITDPGLNLTYGTPNTTVFIEGGDGPIDASAYITLTSEDDSNNGSGCVFTPELNYRVTGGKITNQGFNYQYSPSISISGAQKDFDSPARAAKAQARIKGVCETISITDPGEAYYSTTNIECNRQQFKYGSEIFLYGNGVSAKIAINNSIGSGIIAESGSAPGSGSLPGSGSPPESGSTVELISHYDAINYKFNSGTFPINLDCLNTPIFYEKPLVGFTDTNYISAKTYLEVSSVSVSQTGFCEDNRDHYITTDKLYNINNQFAYIKNIESIFGNTNKIKIKSLCDIDNNYSSCVDNSNWGSKYELYLNNTYLGEYPIPRDPFLSVQGEIVGLSLMNGDNFYGIYLPYAYRYGANDPQDINRSHFIAMPAFFDTLPVLSIEDDSGSSAIVTINKSADVENGLVRLYDFNPDRSGTYQIDNYFAEGASDLIISDASGYSSYSTLVCLEPGVPTSWNNKPTFSVTINSNGEIDSVGIDSGGKGFYPQSSDSEVYEKKYHIYFTGGGGSGGFATYGTDVGDYSPESMTKPIGAIYSAQGSIEVVTVVSGGKGYKTPPTAVVVDYNTTWKEFYLHNKIYGQYTSDLYEDIDLTYSIGPFQMIDFYFKNSKPYESRFAIKNQTSYYPLSLDSERASNSGSNYQAYSSRLFNYINNIPVSNIPPYTSVAGGFDLYYYRYARGWIGQQHYFADFFSDPGRMDIGPVPNKYAIDYFYNNGYVNDVLYESENRYIGYPHGSTNIDIANSGDFTNLVDEAPNFSAIKFSWNEDLISDTVLIRNNTIQ